MLQRESSPAHRRDAGKANTGFHGMIRLRFEIVPLRPVSREISRVRQRPFNRAHERARILVWF